MTTFIDHIPDCQLTASALEVPELMQGLLTGAEGHRLLRIAQDVALISPEPATMVTGLERPAFPEILTAGMPGVEHFRNTPPRAELTGTVDRHLLVHSNSFSAALITISWSALEACARTSVASIGPVPLFEELVVRCTEWTNNGRVIPRRWTASPPPH